MSRAGQQGAQPNIIVLIADQLRADHVGFGGNTEVRTPHLDALAESSTVFSQAHVANPTCMPNRATLLTGRWPSAHGTRCNGIPLRPSSSTFVRQLAKEGYSTAAVGKLHHQNMGWDFEPSQREQIDQTNPVLMDEDAPDPVVLNHPHGWDQWENRARHDAAFVPLPRDYYGYDEVDLVVGHGDAPGGHWTHWARERGVEPEVLGGREASLAQSPSWEQIYTSAIPAELHPSAYIGERAVSRIRAAETTADPFFLFISFPDPHHPFAPPAAYADRYDPQALALPVGFHQDHSRSPSHVRAMMAARGTPDPDPTMAFAVDEGQYRAAAAAQYGLIEFMDEQIGAVLQALHDTGQADNTIIVFTSDHGDMFGDHGLMLKHFVHYRAVTRVPLLVHEPCKSLPGTRTISSLVSTADLAPTLLALAGAPQFRGIQGRSLRPLLDEECDTVRDALLIEEDQPFAPDGLPAPVRMRTVITPQGRMTRYMGSSDEMEIYDHRTDPDELSNIAGTQDSGGLCRALTEAMLTEVTSVDESGIGPTSAA